MGYKINCTECMYKIVREGIHRIALHQKILILHEGEKERLVSISLPLFASVLFSHACFRKKNKEKEPTHWGRLQKQCINLTRWGRLQKHHVGEGFKNIMLGKASKTSHGKVFSQCSQSSNTRCRLSQTTTLNSQSMV